MLLSVAYISIERSDSLSHFSAYAGEKRSPIVPRNTMQLTLTERERAALSVALRTLLNLWGDSEDNAQERIHARLSSIAEKVDALASIQVTRARKRTITVSPRQMPRII